MKITKEQIEGALDSAAMTKVNNKMIGYLDEYQACDKVGSGEIIRPIINLSWDEPMEMIWVFKIGNEECFAGCCMMRLWLKGKYTKKEFENLSNDEWVKIYSCWNSVCADIFCGNLLG